MAPRVALQTRGIQQKTGSVCYSADSGERRRFSWCASLEKSVYFEFKMAKSGGFEVGCTLTIPDFRRGDSRMAESGFWVGCTLHPPNCRWGGFKEVRLHCGFGSACKKRKAEPFRTLAAEPKTGNPRKCPDLRSKMPVSRFTGQMPHHG